MNRDLRFVVPVFTIVQAILAAMVFSQPPGHDVANRSVKLTALMPVGLWFLSLVGVMPRLSWCVGCGLFLMHVAVAFHASHGWSHAEAMAHVEATSGWGEGIFVSYAFALIWLADAAWWAFAPRSYRSRPRGINIAIHLFLAFIIFNATVIYGHGVARLFGIGLFALLAIDKLRTGKLTP